MLDFFVILSNGGIVLWYFKRTKELFRTSINALLRSLILEETSRDVAFFQDNFALKHYRDNEFQIIFIAGYQRILQLSYVDKFLTSVALKFRDKYKNELSVQNYYCYYDGFSSEFDVLLNEAETASVKIPRQMRTFKESEKSMKTVASLIINKPVSNDKTLIIPDKVTKQNNVQAIPKIEMISEPIRPNKLENLYKSTTAAKFHKLSKKQKDVSSPTASPISKDPVKRVKESRKWDNTATGAEAAALDFSAPTSLTTDNEKVELAVNLSANEVVNLTNLRGTLQEGFNELEVSSSGEDYSDDEDTSKITNQPNSVQSSASGGFMSGLMKTLRASTSGRVLTRQDIDLCTEKLRDHLVSKNVALEIANRLCESITERLVGVQLGKFERISVRVRMALEEACTRLLASGRRVDVLRDALEAKAQGRPYVIVFCGVNGVGKSTNLAKITFWLIEKNLRVLIAACDTFRSGAVEQLRTHVCKLNYIHPPEQHSGLTMVELFEKGYGKDAAAIAMSAICYARDHAFDVVMVDTAGRMQDNEPLMRALAKLIITNQPDLVLFVGEALVGNEAVDQLVKFKQSLADCSHSEHPHTIDGILLTKFDTVDDKVGAAISMAYISGEPIVFVGTGQRYSDLRRLSVQSVVKALMK